MLFLYIKQINANIKLVLIATIIIFITLIFPIFINIKIQYLNKEKRLYFTISLYKVLRLLQGYIHLVFDGIAIHLSKFTAILIPYKNLLDMKNKIKPLKDYHVIKLNLSINVGNSESLIFPLFCAFLYRYIEENIKLILYNNKPYVELDGKINVYEGQNLFNFKLQGVAVLNLLMILISLIKIITEKVIYAIKNRKQQNQQRNRNVIKKCK